MLGHCSGCPYVVRVTFANVNRSSVLVNTCVVFVAAVLMLLETLAGVI